MFSRFSRRQLMLASIASAFAKKPAATQPNVVLIVAGNLGAWTLGCYGNREIHTPNLDLLAQTGMRFLNHSVSTPEAAPSLATMLTGLTPRQAGPKNTTVADILATQSYRTSQAADTPSATQFLDAQKAGQPFFLLVSYADPQPPYESASAKAAALYVKTSFDGIGYEPLNPAAATNKEYLKDPVGSIRKFAAAVTTLDEQIPVLLEKLRERGLRESTLVIFTAASGTLLGRHGLWGDGSASEPVNLYDEVLLTPMIWNWPGRTPAQGVRPEVVSAYDLAPTLCEAAGAPVPAGLAGRSYLALATGLGLPKKTRWNNSIFGEYRNTQMVRDNRFKLIVRSGGKGPNELYELPADPREKTNQFNNPQFSTVRDRLTKELAEWQRKYSH